MGHKFLEIGKSAVAPSIEENGLLIDEYPLATISILVVKAEISLVKLGLCRRSCLHDFPTLITRTATVNDQAVAASLRR